MHVQKLREVGVPVYNEEAVFPLLTERVKSLLDRLDAAAEVILVDDGSRDASWKLMVSLAAVAPLNGPGMENRLRPGPQTPGPESTATPAAPGQAGSARTCWRPGPPDCCASTARRRRSSSTGFAPAPRWNKG
ncbi:MAG: glycosyltransferase [Betaproteobacteria bacterium]|nr:glycosyltransferase [Betaproteobacteria bacterium]